MAEYWDIYDKDRQKTGRVQERGKPSTSPDDYHLVVEIWLRNSRGEVLLTKRHPNKHYGGLWECTGGSVLAGEESLPAAVREVKEEIGVDLTQGIPGILLTSLSIRRENQYSAHYDVYLFERDIQLEDLILQLEEVVDAKWVTQQELEQMSQAGLLAPFKAKPFAFFPY